MRHPVRRPPAVRGPRHGLSWAVALLIGALAFQIAQAEAGPVPDFTLQLLNGKTTSLQAHRGKPVLISFFHSQ